MIITDATTRCSSVSVRIDRDQSDDRFDRIAQHVCHFRPSRTLDSKEMRALALSYFSYRL